MSKSIVGTASIYAIGSLITQALNFLAQIVLMRSLSLADYGYYGLSFEVLILLQMVVGGAFRNFYLQLFRNESADVNNLTYYQISNGSLYIGLFSILLYFLYGVGFIISISLTLSFILTSLSLPLQTKMLADNRRVVLIVKDILTSVVSVMTIFVTVKLMRLPVTQVVIVQLIPAVFVSLTYIYRYQKNIFKEFTLNAFYKYAKFKYEPILITFILVFLVNSLHNKLGILYIKHFSELSVLAIYIAAFKFINPTLFIQSSLVSAYMPRFINDKNFRFDHKVFLIFFIPGLAVTLALYFLFPYVISFLNLTLYTNTYSLIKIGTWFILVVFIYGPMSNYISVSGGQKFILIANCFAFSLYLVAALITGVFLTENALALGIVFCFILAECLIGFFYYLYLAKKKMYISFLFPFSLVMILSISTSIFINII
ncbi:hypothetical protein ACL2XO_18620 [Sodalis sp. RH15]|uniref:hypothetical protein n=1 Tax=Sodalis sp. RH15 TaxID=3394330 RepID=UPI0039B42809